MASHFLWSVEITGNERVTDDLMQDFLKQHGIYYGMPLKKIPMYDLKTDLRNQYDEITWVSMKLNGTCLDISVKENQDIYSDVSGAEKEAMSLIAPADGVIEQILLREGTVLKKEGDEVRKGEVIIEGKVNIPAEDGTIKETRYCKADGDVWILYDYPVSKKLLLEYKTKIYTGKEMKKILIYGKKSKLGLDLRKIPYLKYDYIEETIELPLLDILSFPLEIKKITYRDYIIQKKKYTLEEANKILSEECGVEILDDFYLMSYMKHLSFAKAEYDKLKSALDQVKETGYGVVVPTLDEMTLEEPQIIKKGGASQVKLKATAPSLHIMRVDVETEVCPQVGSAEQSLNLAKFMLQEFESNPKGIWDTNMFGKPLSSFVKDGIETKINNIPVEAEVKMRKTMTKIVNEGKGGIICILL